MADDYIRVLEYLDDTGARCSFIVLEDEIVKVPIYQPMDKWFDVLSGKPYMGAPKEDTE